jgi:signal transduction histidine kinase
MTFANEIIVLMLNLIILGMTVHAKSLYAGRQDARPSRALIMTFASAKLSAISALAFIWVSPVFLTLTNTLLLVTLCCAVLTVRSWRLSLSVGLVRGCVALILCIALVFEVLRQNGNYLQRVVVYSVLSALFFSWLLYEAWQKQRQENSFQLKFLMGVAVASLGFRLGRMAAALMQDVQPETLFQEGSAPAVLRLMSLSMDVLILSSLLGYNTYVLTVRNQRVEEDNERVRTANLALDAALAENTQMLKALTMSVKSKNMGVLMASLAHELSQPLQLIRTKTELLASMPELQARDRQSFIQGLIEDNNRAGAIIVQLRKFLRSGSSDFNTVDLDQVVAESLAMIQAELTRFKIKLTQEVDGTVTVWANQAQLQMVVLNLLKNALDALRSVPSPREIHLQLRQTERVSLLSVSDNGPGMTESERARVFEMFYSTKNEGMGLGLWLSHSILKHHGGQLQVSASPLGGACFTMTLPIRLAVRYDG